MGKTASVQPTRNYVTLDGSGNLRWNDVDITLDELAELLAQTKKMRTEPEIQFVPSVNAPYEKSVEILRVFKQSGVTKFGLVGSEKHRATEATPD